MSGIYIPGVKIPRDCPMCPLSYWNAGGNFSGCGIVNGKKFAMNDPDYASSNKRPDWCPLVPVPGHGRLIDADDFIKRINELVRQAHTDGFDLGAAWYTAFIRHIELSPTIIPADHIGDVNEMVTDKEGEG